MTEIELAKIVQDAIFYFTTRHFEQEEISTYLKRFCPPLPSGAKKEDIQPVLRWVKASERTPENKHNVSVKTPFGTMTGWYSGADNKWLTDSDYTFSNDEIKWLEELSSSQNVPKSEELGNIRKQSIIELMEDDQRDGVYGVREIEQELLECYKKAWVAKNSPDYDAEGHPHYYGDIDYTSEFNSTVFGELVRELIEDTLLNSIQEDKRVNINENQ